MKEILENKKAFSELVVATSADIGLAENQVEKDFMVSLLLDEIAKSSPVEIVFKGGTSLSKCYDVINRFSEDIDISVKFKGDKFTRVERRRLKEGVIKAINAVGFKLLNFEEIKSGRDFNKYIVQFPKIFEGIDATDPNIIIETIVAYKPYPYETKLVGNYVTKFLKNSRNEELIKKYNLESFEMSVQTLERTFLDKLFAICDYHFEKNYTRYSRHIYDIHMIWTSGLLKIDFLDEILIDVIKDRQINGRSNHSCKPMANPQKYLKSIINTDVYKEDFENLTSFMIYDEVTYSECMVSLIEIARKNLLPSKINKY